LFLSLATAAFSLFQWWYGQKATKAAAAVDVSRTYLRERDNELMDKEYDLIHNIHLLPEKEKNEYVMKQDYGTNRKYCRSSAKPRAFGDAIYKRRLSYCRIFS